MYVIFVLAIIFTACLFFLLDRALKAIQRGRRRRVASKRLVAAAIAAEEQHRRQEQQLGEEIRPLVGVPRQQEVLQQRCVLKQLDVLKRAGDAAACDRVGGDTRDVLAGKRQQASRE